MTRQDIEREARAWAEHERLLAVLLLAGVLFLANLCVGCAVTPRRTIYHIREPIAFVVGNNPAFSEDCRTHGVAQPSSTEGLCFGRIIYIRESHWQNEWTAHELRHLNEIEGDYHQ